MFHNYPLIGIKEDPNYDLALEVLSSVLYHEFPDEDVLKEIYGKLTPVIIYQIERYFENFPMENLNIRQHYEYTSVISKARLKLEENTEFARLHSKILNNQIPDIDEVYPIYGKYSEDVIKILQLYKKENIKRRCGIPAAAHSSRVGAIVFILNFDDVGHSEFCTSAFMHDSIEDLIKSQKKPSDHYGIMGIENFINDYIPEKLQPNIRLLTNHYSMILNYLQYLLRMADKHLKVGNLLLELDSLSSQEWALQNQSIKLHNLLKTMEPFDPSFDEFKWESYKALYIKELADNAKNMTDFRTFEIKSIDLTDNAHSSAALSMSEKLKNIQKLSIWASHGYELRTNWLPTNNFIQEVFEDALVYAENFVIKDFLEPVSKQDFFASALYKIQELKSVFYVKKEFNSIS